MKDRTTFSFAATPVQAPKTAPTGESPTVERHVLLAAVSLLGLSVGVAAAQQPSAAPQGTPTASKEINSKSNQGKIEWKPDQLHSNQGKSTSNQGKSTSNQQKSSFKPGQGPSNQIKSPSNQLKEATPAAAAPTATPPK